MSKILEQLDKLKTIVLGHIGKEKFDTDGNGKEVLSSEDEAKLSSAFTPSFLEQFKKGLDTEAVVKEQEKAAKATLDQLKSDHQVKMAEMVEKVNGAVKAKEDAERLNETLKEAVDALSSEKEQGIASEVIQMGGMKSDEKQAWHGVKANRKYFHNQMAFEALDGNTGKAMGVSHSSFGTTQVPGMSGNTINVDEIYTEFGTYLSNAGIRLDIMQKMLQKTESQNYMTTKQAITEWRASAAMITSVVQQFVAKWTPLGSSKFTPLTIKNRHHKVNLPITPDDINDSWLSYLYDEGVTPDQMPVTRFIIEKLLRPRIENDIEMLMIATGVYEELGTVTEGSAGQATGKNMDGYVTILKNEKLSGTSAINFFDPSTVLDGFTELTDDNIVDVIEKYSDWVEELAPLYAKAGMNIFIDPNLYKRYQRKYRELYPTTKNEDGKKSGPDFSNLTFVPLNAMRGAGVFFSVPKENFIRLIHKNAAGGETKLFLQVENYTIKVFGEFWLGVGFAMAELVFGYIPQSDESGSGL